MRRGDQTPRRQARPVDVEQPRQSSRAAGRRTRSGGTRPARNQAQGPRFQIPDREEREDGTSAAIKRHLLIADCGLLIADCGLRINECGLRIADCGLKNGELAKQNKPAWPLRGHRCDDNLSQSAILNPQSAITRLPSAWPIGKPTAPATPRRLSNCLRCVRQKATRSLEWRSRPPCPLVLRLKRTSRFRRR